MRLLPKQRLLRMAVLAATLMSGLSHAEPRFVIYYGDTAQPGTFDGYNVIVLNGEHHPVLAGLPPNSATFGYLSLGEAAHDRGYFPAARQAGVLLGGNPNWPGSFYVDLRKPAWQHLVLDQLAPAILAQGFQGLFLDTLDDAAFLEKADPKRNAGMVEAAAGLVHALHVRFPNAPIILNRAYEIQAQVAPDLWGVLGESVLTDYAFAKKQYVRQSASDASWQMDQLRTLRAHYPALHVFTLDYWTPSDQGTIRRLYAQQRQAGNTPYVATIDLQRIVPEPAP